ncbi:MAG: ABC transporter transmembrane domain-containing protein [Burkholderiales bacterium]|jgi:ATP-binding cassette subfamily B protein|nr:ABC transporter transmembrane domain-containing protein [Burkholderiales bacterium]
MSALSILWRFARPYRARMAAFTVALFVAAGCFLAMGEGLKRVVDRGFASGTPRELDLALLYLLGVVAVTVVATFFRFYLISWLGERVVADLRRAVFTHLLRLQPAWFEDARTGEMISRLTTDTTLLEQVVGTSVSMALRNLAMGLGALVMLAVTSLKLTLLVLGLVPIVMGPIVLFGRRVRKLSRASQDRVADLAAEIDETLHEIRTVQAYVHEPVDARRFGDHIESTFDAARRRVRMRAMLVAAVISLTFGGIGVILWVGGHDVMSGALTPGELSAFVFYAAMVASASGALSEVVGDLQRGAGAAERLVEIMNTTPAIAAPAAPQRFPAVAPAVGQARLVFDSVTFAYPSRPGTPALDRFDLSVATGETVALVGPSGAGKSTVFQMLLRFHDPQAGSVRVDGLDLRDVDPAALRSRFAIVAQDPAIFATTVLENVRYGRPDADEAAVRAACEAAFADEFIAKLPDGWRTPLGERGVRLSGGQRQRLAIARAVLADRPVLLLDEATSALDAESERMVQRALAQLMQGRTSLVIAHRLATVRGADRIVVVDGGRAIASGTHDELLAASPLYAHLAQLQFGVPS